MTGDVVAWAERAWIETGRGKYKKALLAGVRTVTGEVLRSNGRLITLKVLKAARLASVYEPVELPKNGETIKRKLETIVKGAGHRMLWSDVALTSTSLGESARAVVASIFLGPEPAPAPKAAVSPRPAYSRRGGNSAAWGTRGRGPRARPKRR